MTKLDLTSATRLLRTKILAYYVQLSSSMRIRIRDWTLGESFGMIHLKRTGSKEWFAHESDISRTRLSSREREQLTHTNTNRGESKETLSKFSACPTTHTHTHTIFELHGQGPEMRAKNLQINVRSAKWLKSHYIASHRRPYVINYNLN